MQKHYPLIILLCGIMMLDSSCCRKDDRTSGAEAIKKADRSYSELSARKGMNSAFLEMFSDSGVILRKNHRPVEGIAAIRELLLQEEDTSFTLTWEPLKAVVAASGDLGYSYGTYKIISKSNQLQVGEGTYATIWEKDRRGQWHAVLDTGNTGLKAPAEGK